jgi:4-hydroxybenzoate polyprenyltransferase
LPLRGIALIERVEPNYEIPLCIDLDGTLIHADLLDEALLQLVKLRPLDLASALPELRHGKTAFKRKIATIARLDPDYLPYNAAVLDLVREAHDSGRTTVLVTAADERWARAVATHLGCFDAVIASDGRRNLSGPRKRDALIDHYGRSGFDYAGNARADLAVWRAARNAIVVNATADVVRRAGRVASVSCVLPAPPTNFKTWRRALRIHQWSKNLLVFVPLIVSHQFLVQLSFTRTLMGFFAISLCASALYIVNDLLDLDADRAHPAKCNRPFAAGVLSVRSGLLAVPLLLAAGFAIAGLDGAPDELYIGTYVVATLAYSLFLKRKVLVDIVVLALLYTMRIMVGGATLGINVSHWLLGFSLFIFFSLAALKRFSELEELRSRNVDAKDGRGYHVGDVAALAQFGSASAFMAVVVYCLYISSPSVDSLYRHPDFLWLMCPLLIYWLSRAWLFAHRGWVNSDPIVFAFRDRASYLVAIACLAVGIAAK